MRKMRIENSPYYQRNMEIYNLRLQGQTLQEIGSKYRVSRQYIKQITDKLSNYYNSPRLFCKKCNEPLKDQDLRVKYCFKCYYEFKNNKCRICQKLIPKGTMQNKALYCQDCLYIKKPCSICGKLISRSRKHQNWGKNFPNTNWTCSKECLTKFRQQLAYALGKTYGPFNIKKKYK